MCFVVCPLRNVELSVKMAKQKVLLFGIATFEAPSFLRIVSYQFTNNTFKNPLCFWLFSPLESATCPHPSLLVQKEGSQDQAGCWSRGSPGLKCFIWIQSRALVSRGVIIPLGVRHSGPQYEFCYQLKAFHIPLDYNSVTLSFLAL